MLPIPEKYLLSPCEIKDMDNKPILIGCLSAITDNEIQISNKTDSLPVIHCNTTVRVSIFNNTFGFQVLVGKVYLSTESFIRLVDLQSEANYEKRNFFRVKVEIQAEAVPQRSGHAAPGKAFPVQVMDLSLSGLYFISSQKLKIGDRLKLRLKLNEIPVLLCCRVVRKLVVERAMEDGYGCQFLDQSEVRSDLMCKYLFDCQREQIRKMKENQL